LPIGGNSIRPEFLCSSSSLVALKDNHTDDDNNGKKDDWHGWNFVDNNNDPMDDETVYGMKEFHGTFTAGIAGAAAQRTQ